jgi:hypothetical protein
MILQRVFKLDSPEPEKDVNLLVDDVLSENAKAVLDLNSTGGTVLMEGAFRHL